MGVFEEEGLAPTHPSPLGDEKKIVVIFNVKKCAKISTLLKMYNVNVPTRPPPSK